MNMLEEMVVRAKEEIKRMTSEALKPDIPEIEQSRADYAFGAISMALNLGIISFDESVIFLNQIPRWAPIVESATRKLKEE